MNNNDYLKAVDVFPRIDIAIEAILLGEGDARNRLKNAMITITPLRPEDFPKKHVKVFKKIMDDIGNLDKFKMTEIDNFMLNNEGAYYVYFSKIKNTTAIKYIKILYEIYKELLKIKSNYY